MTRDEFAAELRLFLARRVGAARPLLDSLRDEELVDFFSCFAYGARDIPAADMDAIIAASMSLTEAFLRTDVFNLLRIIPDPEKRKEAFSALYPKPRPGPKMLEPISACWNMTYDPGGGSLR